MSQSRHSAACIALALAGCAGAPKVVAPAPPENLSPKADVIAAAAMRGDVAALEGLAAQGMDLDVPLDAYDTRAVSLAAVWNRTQALELLLSRGTLPNPVVRRTELLRRVGGGTVSDTVTLAMRAGSGEAVELLLRYGAAPAGRGREALQQAVRRCNARTTEQLIRFGAIATASVAEDARTRCAPGIAEMVAANVTGTAAFAKATGRLGDLVRRALAASERKDHATAAAIFEQAVAMVARVPGMHRMLAAEYAALGDHQRAYEQRNRYLELSPSSPLAHSVRAELLASPPADRTLRDRIRPAWAVRWRCDGKSLEECREQCERGNGGSCVEAGRLAESGETPARPEQVRGWFERGCDLGATEACYLVAKAHYNGSLGVPKDLAKAEDYSERGCAVEMQLSCHLQALTMLARIGELEDPRRSDFDRPFAVLETMCQQQDQLGCSTLGMWLLEDFGFGIDVARGTGILDRLCRDGWDSPCTYLADQYERGDALPRDPKKAADYRALAAKLPKSGVDVYGNEASRQGAEEKSKDVAVSEPPRRAGPPGSTGTSEGADLFASRSLGHVRSYENVTWANDDSGLLVCRHDGDLMTEWLGGATLANAKLHLEIRSRDGSLLRNIGDFPDESCNPLFVFRYMATAGYAIVNSLQISLADGTTRRLPEGLPLPSPDGRTIAMISLGGGDPGRVVFIDARDHKVVAGPLVIPYETPFATWTPGGELLIAQRPPGTRAALVAIDGQTKLKFVPRPECVPQPIRAGAVNSTGERVRLSGDSLIFSEGPDRSDGSFGCFAPPPDEARPSPPRNVRLLQRQAAPLRQQQAVAADAVLAEGDGIRITAAEFQARMADLAPFDRSGYATLERKRDFLHNLVRFRVLAREARRRGLDRDPHVRDLVDRAERAGGAATNAVEKAHIADKAMVQRLVRSAMDDLLVDTAGPAPSESTLRAAYDAGRDEFVRPARVCISLHPVVMGEGSQAAHGESVAESGGASPIAPACPDDRRYKTREELAAQHGEMVASAALALERAGDYSPVVATRFGLFTIRLEGRRQALNRSFDEVKGLLAKRRARELAAQKFNQTVERLEAEAHIRYDETVLDRIVIR